MLAGAYTALITPFIETELDSARLVEQVRRQVDGGVDGVVPVGTTGESPTLSHVEHRRVIEEVVKAVDGRVKVVAGTGSNSTREALALTKHAREAGVDAALMVNPYYNKPTQEGLYRHFMTVADAVDLPICLYNIPGRTNVTMSADTVVRLYEHDNIVAIKEATGSLDLASEIAGRCDIAIVSGDDSLTLPLMSVGATGVISVLSNLFPERIVALVRAAQSGDFAEAKRRHLELFALCKGCLTLATNPIPIKAAMQIAGHDTGEVRLPLTELDADGRARLEALLATQLPAVATSA